MLEGYATGIGGGLISQPPFLLLSPTPSEPDDRAEISWTIFRRRTKPDRDSCPVADSEKKKPTKYKLRNS